jgi:hypothetical protein
MRMGVSNQLEVLQLPKFPHFEGEGGDGGPAVDGLRDQSLHQYSLTSRN